MRGMTQHHLLTDFLKGLGYEPDPIFDSEANLIVIRPVPHFLWDLFDGDILPPGKNGRIRRYDYTPDDERTILSEHVARGIIDLHSLPQIEGLRTIWEDQKEEGVVFRPAPFDQRLPPYNAPFQIRYPSASL